jgi:ubiquinone/menaquinone biosynthesis C-methylase UbiE
MQFYLVNKRGEMHERRFNREIEWLRDPERITRLEVDRVVGLVLEGINGSKTILDIGTGSGVFAEQFSKIGLEVTGLDVNPEMLVVAQQFVPSGTFQQGIAEKLPFLDQSFDIVFMGFLLHETDNLQMALSEAYRVGKKRLAILEWPFQEQTFGPPLDHRIESEKIFSAARMAGFNFTKSIQLESLILYLLEKE